MPNTSWNLLDAMLQRRAWGVETSTAQMEIIGRRHYGRKAVPAGGGGGRATRELLDTLLLWQPRVQLDAQGQATVRCRSTTRSPPSRSWPWPMPAPGCSAPGRPHPRHAGPADHQRPAAAGARGRPVPRPVHAAQHHGQAHEGGGQPRATLLELKPQTVDIPPARRASGLDVTAPAQLGQTRAEALLWEIEAKDSRRRPRRAQGQPAHVPPCR
jgi:hypothetical protein